MFGGDWGLVRAALHKLPRLTLGFSGRARGDGRTKNDIVIADDGSIYLRAERTGSGAGRVYTITYEAVDDSGNATIGSAEVLVPEGYQWRRREHIRTKTLDTGEQEPGVRSRRVDE